MKVQRVSIPHSVQTQHKSNIVLQQTGVYGEQEAKLLPTGRGPELYHHTTSFTFTFQACFKRIKPLHENNSAVEIQIHFFESYGQNELCGYSFCSIV